MARRRNSAGTDDPILVQLILGAVSVIMTFPGLYNLILVVERVLLALSSLLFSLLFSLPFSLLLSLRVSRFNRRASESRCSA